MALKFFCFIWVQNVELWLSTCQSSVESSYSYLTNNWEPGVSAAWTRQLFKAGSCL